MTAWLSTFGLGILYFVAAVPAGAAMGLNVWNAAFAAWAGYMFITAAALAAGAPVRKWVCEKWKISSEPDPSKLFWRVWLRWGMPGLALLAPVLCGPYVAAFLAVGLGCKPVRAFWWIVLGVVPWCIAFAILTLAGVKITSG